MVEQAGGAERIAAIGITNQRETVVVWDRATGEPLARAIVWQDRRTADFCDELRDGRARGGGARGTGLLLDPYFSATKMRWRWTTSRRLREAARRPAGVGTVESWLVFKLTGGARTSPTRQRQPHAADGHR